MFDIKAWGVPPKNPHMVPNQLQIWRVQLQSMSPQINALRACLSQEECEQADRFVKAEDRSRFIISHAILRLILSRYLNQSAQDLRFKKGSHGKPYLEEQSLQFNMTHSHDVALYAFALNTEVGVDVEYIKRIANRDDLVERFFSEKECAAYHAFPEDERCLAFYRAWTRKEAYIKAVGLGLSYPLQDFDVSLVSEARKCLLHVNDPGELAQDWTLFSFSSYPGYLASVAIKESIEKCVAYDGDAVARGEG